MDKKECGIILKKLKQVIPNPAIELVSETPFELLISVILSAHSTDVGVNKVTAKLFPIANTPQQILDLGEEGLKEYIKSIGLYNTKASNIIKTCKILVDEYSSKIPDNRIDLEKLPGVGRKCANIILNIVFNQPTIAVDTHIFRVCNRTKLATGKTPLEVEKKLLTIVPDDVVHIAHHLLLLHGRYVCTSRKPKCESCIIHDLCKWDC